MSYQVMAWARGIKTGSITVKAVLMAVANYADEKGVSWPSQEQLADDVEASRHTVLRALDVLAEGGLLRRERRHRQDGSRTSDRLILNLGLSSIQQRSTEQRCSEQRCNVQDPMLQAATAEPVIEPPLSSLRSDTPRAKPTPRSELEAVLDADRAKAVIEHRKAKRAPLTAHAAGLLAKQLGRWPDPNEAADEMIEAGWTGFKILWMERRMAEARGQGPPGRQSRSQRELAGIAEAFDEDEQDQRPDDGSLAGNVLSLPKPRAGWA